MKKKYLVIIIIIFTFLYNACSVDEKCYVCEGYQGTLWMTYSNVCGNEMLNYYRNIGFNCTRDKSPAVVNIAGPEHEIDESKTSNDNGSDCLCEN